MEGHIIQGRPKKSDHFQKCITPVYNDVGVQYITMFSSLSEIRLVFRMSSYLNIISITSEK